MPFYGALQRHLLHLPSGEGHRLRALASTWRSEMEWLQNEIRVTTADLDAARVALRPVAQRLSHALGAAAPEPQVFGLGLTQCALLKEEAAGRASRILSKALADRPRLPLERRLLEMLSASGALMLQLQQWPREEPAPLESRMALFAAARKLTPTSDANRGL